jgi:2,3-bisphosphoglycerate-independent phosphoglycerate mutase
MSFTIPRAKLLIKAGCAVIAGCGLLFGLQAAAHHSVSGQFDVNKKVVLTGTVEKVDWVNPHIYVHLKVTDEKGHAAV